MQTDSDQVEETLLHRIHTINPICLFTPPACRISWHTHSHRHWIDILWISQHENKVHYWEAHLSLLTDKTQKLSYTSSLVSLLHDLLALQSVSLPCEVMQLKIYPMDFWRGFQRDGNECLFALWFYIVFSWIFLQQTKITLFGFFF